MFTNFSGQMASAFLTGFFVASSAFASATLRIPVFVEGDTDPVPMAVYNAKFKAAGLPLLPEFLEVSSSELGHDKWNVLEKSFAKNTEKLGSGYKNISLAMELVPGSNNTAALVTCYRGQAKDVIDIVKGMTDIPYSDQLILWGYKYKNTKTFLETDDNDSELDEYLAKGSDLWKNWKGQNEDLLILSSVGDDGTDVNESLIPLCK